MVPLNMIQTSFRASNMDQIHRYCIRLEELVKIQLLKSNSSKKFLYRLPILSGHMTELYFVLPRIIEEIYVKKTDKLHTNYPVDVKSSEYAMILNTNPEKGHTCGDFLYYKLDLDPSISGTWYIRFPDHSPIVYFQVPPRISIKTLSNEYLQSIDEICLLTLVPRFMGPLNTWIDIIRQSREDHSYNCFHFLPMLKRGESDSPYSIYDQLSLSVNDMFPDTLDADYWNLFSDTIRSMKKDPGGIFLVDIVWNHTAFDSPWLKHHPEAGYNAYNSPHLRPAILLDDAIITFSLEYLNDFSPSNESDISSMLKLLKDHYIPNNYGIIKRYFTLDFDLIVKTWIKRKRDIKEANEIDVIVKRLFSSFMGSDNHWKIGKLPFDISLLDKIRDSLIHPILEQFQQTLFQYYHDCVDKSMKNIYNRMVYERLDPKGPRISDFKFKSLVSPYFTRITKDQQTKDDDHVIFDQFDFFANNGWVWNADPNVNFATCESNAYFCREVIIWGDCVKLRYDENEMFTWLWEHMKQYTVRLAGIFDGFRIDNCHSTPMNVAKHFINVARKINPNIYIFAELFTGSSDKDMEFVTRLGINSLLRESMVCLSMNSLSHQLWTSGGLPIGSFDQTYRVNDTNLELLLPCAPHTLLMDCTHDNQTSFEQGRDPVHALANAALVSFSNGAIGSTKGYDELSTRRLEFVGSSSIQYSNNDNMARNCGLFPIRKLLNKLHILLSKEYIERHIDASERLIKMTRGNPRTHEEYILIARPSFNLQDSAKCLILDDEQKGHIRYRSSNEKQFASILNDKLTSWIINDEDDIKVVLWARIYIKCTASSPDVESNETNKDASMNNGFSTLQNTIEYDSSTFSLLSDEHKMFTKVRISSKQWKITLNSEEFHPGSIIVMRKSNSYNFPRSFAGLDAEIRRLCTNEELNILLFRTGEEERERFPNLGAYDIPNYGSTRFCGFFGIYWILEHDQIRMKHDLGHPLCENIRRGNWLMNYLTDRLKYYEMHVIHDALKEIFARIESLPYYLKPKYVCQTVEFVTQLTIQMILGKCGVMDSCSIVDRLLIGMTALKGNMSIKSGLFPVELTESHPLHTLLSKCCRILSLVSGGKVDHIKRLSLSAGLPHFSISHMRIWGRDVFISFFGAFITTNKPIEGLIHIIAFASCLYRGLIPNLLDSGRYPRYNSRDATWWFLRAIKQFIEWLDTDFPGTLIKILQLDIPMRFGSFEQHRDGWCHWQETRAYKSSAKLSDIIHYIMLSHAQGIDFVEDRAGKQLDHAMKKEGFHIQIRTEFKNGFIYGGNKWNCGTWMDKMGDTHGTMHFGVPATPRDGACIELIALLYDILCWLNVFCNTSFKHKGVNVDQELIKWSQWKETIEKSFESAFFVNINGEIYYRDMVGCSDSEREMQLRPNYVVAMSIAPKLFDNIENAFRAIRTAEKYLVHGMGLRTLAPFDPSYRPSFNPHDTRSGDLLTMNGFNYHNGPSWVWLYGHYLQVKKNLGANIWDFLKPHCLYLLSNHEISLPELLENDKKASEFGCFIQTWSLATVLEAIYRT